MHNEPTRVAGGSLFRSRRWLLIAPALLLLWIVGQIDKTNISLIIANETFISGLHLAGHNAELGGLMSYFLLGYGGAIFLWGFLVDRFGPRVCAIAGIICWGGCLLLSSRVTTIGELLALRFLLGMAEGNLWPVGNALTNRWFPVSEHSRAQSFWIIGSTLGTAIGVPVVALLLLSTGWRNTFAYLALLSLLPVVFLLFVSDGPRDKRGNSPSELPQANQESARSATVRPLAFRQLFRHTPFWVLTACQLVSATMIFTLVQWIPRFLTVYRHQSFKAMSGWITVGYLLATALTLLSGYIADRTMQRALTGFWVCVIFALAVLPGAFLLSPAASAVLLSTLVGAAAITAAINGALMHQMVSPEAVARGTGIYVGVGNCLSGIGPFVFGYSITELGGRYWGGFLYLALLAVLGAVCYVALHRQASRAVALQAAALLRSRSASISRT